MLIIMAYMQACQTGCHQASERHPKLRLLLVLDECEFEGNVRETNQGTKLKDAQTITSIPIFFDQTLQLRLVTQNAATKTL